MSVHILDHLIQGTDEWLEARRGIVTASVVGQLVTTTHPDATEVGCPDCGAEVYNPCVSRARKAVAAPIKSFHASRVALAQDLEPVIVLANNDTSRALTTLLAAERITGWSNPVYVNRDMERGTYEEPIAREAYAQHTGVDVAEVGFMVRAEHDWRLGYSPDGLVGDDGLIEIKSRRAKAQVATVLADAVPAGNMAQIQAGLLVSGRAWCDYVSFCGGLPLYVKRVYPDLRWFEVITAAARLFEINAAHIVATFTERTTGMPLTERTNFDLDLVF
ncbi:lambda exonuclease family protein [Cellulomonas shaoxiangyii]|uniref:Uncharacterized protein n=1 Tax=Cellulomonas shaoxiangyii TaxID=2566013 RepID=A0A4P7SJP0_9CELL|nr:lambda exonuclease family protein [Cellulomonas shaoxiangyii]QCB93326.1 hypothetical protein E5225_06940 [Cellulomonas shaoxiangyii]TGY79431.1 hypothetical protein E5226_15470 [Cellulomonas shaoxiangyii]